MTAPATVLVADDHASVRDGVARLLRSAGYRVLTAADGERALEICRSEHPDAAILDLTLPHTDGRAVCRALRADPAAPYVPVLALAVGADSALRAAVLRDGADGVLDKDYDKDELLARVEAVLRVRRLLVKAQPASPVAGGTPNVGRDALTGAWSAAYLQERLDSELQRASRRNEPLSLMAVLLDERARLAGEHGAATGDLALVAAAQAIGRCSRGMDIVARCSAPDFAVILPATHFAGAMATADRVWRELARTRVPLATGTEAALRASIGIACFPNRQAQTGRELLAVARTALKRARTEGPAHICLVQHQAYIFRPE